MKKIIGLAGIAVAAASVSLSGCALTAGSDLQASCNSYVQMSSAHQLHLASEWANPGRDGKTTNLSDAVADQDRSELLDYCGQSGHGHDHLANLDYQFG